MNKEELLEQDGIVVELRNREIGIIWDGIALLKNYWVKLKSNHSKEYDIIRIFKTINCLENEHWNFEVSIDYALKEGILKLIWKEKEEIDWNKVKKDTLIKIEGFEDIERHFSHTERGLVFYYAQGADSGCYEAIYSVDEKRVSLSK